MGSKLTDPVVKLICLYGIMDFMNRVSLFQVSKIKFKYPPFLGSTAGADKKPRFYLNKVHFT